MTDQEQVKDTILIVEDDDDIRDTLGCLLSMEGFKILYAANGKMALDLLKNTAKEKLPALIFLDLMMPVMTGQQFLEIISKDKRLSTIPVAIISAGQCKEKWPCVVKFLKKPVDLFELIQIAEQFAIQ